MNAPEIASLMEYLQDATSQYRLAPTPENAVELERVFGHFADRVAAEGSS